MVWSFTDLFEHVRQEGYIDELVVDPTLQRGAQEDRMLGADILPERNVANSYTETQVKYAATPPAMSGGLYSPAQLQSNGVLMGSVKVALDKKDIAATLNADQLDEIGRELKQMEIRSSRHVDSRAIQSILNFVYTSILLPLLQKNEIERWQCLLLSQVFLRGNGFDETVQYYRPDEHFIDLPSGTAANPAGWHSEDNSYDPILDLARAQTLLMNKGYRVSRIIATTAVSNILRTNKRVIERAAGMNLYLDGINARGDQPKAIISPGAVSSLLESEELAPLEKYDGWFSYRDDANERMVSRRFMDVDPLADYLIVLGTTRRSYDLILPDEEPVTLGNTLGYYGIGTVPTSARHGRLTNTMLTEKYPKSFYAEGIEMGLPVVTHPDAFVVFRIQKPTP